MVISCSAYACTNKWSRDSPIHFHKFPFRSRKMCEHWVRALKRKDFVPTRASLVCSDHFREEDYVSRPGLTKRMLKKDAVPSIFNFPVPGIRSPSPYFDRCQSKKEKKFGNPSRRKELVDLNNYDSLVHEYIVCDNGEVKANTKTECITVNDIDFEEMNLEDIKQELASGSTIENVDVNGISEEDDLIEMAEADEEDKCYILGSIWGERLKLLSDDMRRRVRNLVNKIFQDAQKGTLDENVLYVCN